jgi:hypothetical protein
LVGTVCPLCEELIELGSKLAIKKRIKCLGCKAVLEVISLNPIKLDWLYFDQNINMDDATEDGTYTSECPLCRHVFKTPSKLILGQCILCPACEVELEVVWINPLELGWPYGNNYQCFTDSYRRDIDVMPKNIVHNG